MGFRDASDLDRHGMQQQAATNCDATSHGHTAASDVRVRNCEQEDDWRDTLAAHVVVRVQTAVTEQATASEGSERIDIPPDLRAYLERAVAQAYQDAYWEAMRLLMDTEFVVPGEMMTTLRLRESQQRYAGTVALSMNGKAYTAAYEHVLSVPYATSLEEEKCDT